MIAVAGFLAALFSAALAVDLGRIAWNKRQLQSVADLAALDAVRAFGPCRAEPGDPVAAAQASAVRNGFAGSLAVAPNSVAIGRVATGAGGVREFSPGGDPVTASAVRVLASESRPLSMFASAFLPGDTQLSVRAVARRTAVAGLRAGSYLARVNPTSAETLNELLGGMLEGDVGLDVLSYENLLGASVTLGDLVVAAGVGGLDEFLDLELSVGEYLEVVATALDRRGESHASAALRGIGPLPGNSQRVDMDELFSVAPEEGDAALELVLDAFDLLDLGAQVARGDAAISIDPLGVTLPGLASVVVRVKIIQAPQFAAGPPGRGADGRWQTRVRTGQVRMALELRFAGGMGLLGNNAISADLFVEAAPTIAHLDAIDCASGADPVHRVVVGVEPGLVRLGVGRYPDFDTSPEPVPSELVRIGTPVPVAQVTAAGDLPFQSSGRRLYFEGPFTPQIEEPSEENTQTIGSEIGDAVAHALVSLVDETQLDVVLLGADPVPVPERVVFQRVAQELAAVLGQVGFEQTLTTLFEGLGIHLGGADITVTSLHATQPELAL